MGVNFNPKEIIADFGKKKSAIYFPKIGRGVKRSLKFLVQTSFCGEVGFGIWLSNTTEKFENSLKNLKTHSAAPREF